LILELVYNSVDEAIAGYCNLIHIHIHPQGRVEVGDNGRGIPVETHPATGLSGVETVMTRLHSGAKFGGKAYRISGGLHGVGAALVNALSSQFKVEVRWQGKVYVQEYQQGKPISPLTMVGKTKDSGTTITFIPDKEIFPFLNYDFDVIAQRLREIAYLNPGLEISLFDHGQDREMTFYFEGGIVSLVNHLNRNKAVLHSPVYIKGEMDSTAVEIAFQYNDGFQELVLCFANCINTAEGGSHLTGFHAALTRVLNDYSRKNRLLKDEEPNFIGEDVREGLSAVISVKLPEPQFEGQTKTRLGNPEVKSQVENMVVNGLSQYLEAHPVEAKAIVEKCLIASRAREAAKRARSLRRGVDVSPLPGKLADCSEKDASRRELFIVEGESAGGSAKQGRDPRFQAILPLRGKILNVEKAPKERIIGDEEIRAIIAALGGDDSPSKLRYHRIIIMTDADVDGSHIRTLLLTLFYRHLPELIRRGHLFIAQPPLYRVQVGKEPTWVYSEGEKERLLHKSGGKVKEVQRYKGLGEMSPQQLWETTMNPATRTILKVEIEDAQKADELFRILMGEEVPPRKAFIQTHAKSVRNLDI
jgi:DNA gyrase subunit B